MRRRVARLRPTHPDWGAVAWVHEPRRLPILGAAFMRPALLAALLAAGALFGASFFNGLALQSARLISFLVLSGLLLLAVVGILSVCVARDRRRIRRAIRGGKCIRCGYELLKPAQLRRPIEPCATCPECGYRHPFHPVPVSSGPLPDP
ncbi:MAG: hypothetical protein ACF8R7_02950 [Phycisphaerales bacterium JB039]